jgi:putative membrane-bound dehydrogenase-like protein
MVAAVTLAVIACPLIATAEETGIRAPAGFRVEQFAGDDLAHDIYSMTLDAQGRVVVSGRDYVKTLHDDNGDGRADRATLYSATPASGAHGMLFLGNDLLCTGDNSLMLLRDVDGDGVADGEPEKWAALRNPEHGANGLVRGPDGWIYLICGNDAGVSAELARTPGSPVKQPQSGAIVRFSPDGKRSDIFAHGFRNPYDLDFNAAGHLFTVDADGERDHHLPWYAPTRLFDIAPGMHHGWVLNGWQRSWSRPAYFSDNVPRLVELGRGSPTGLVVYQHKAFPPQYRGSVLSCCWTFGRVYRMPLSAVGATYTTPVTPEVFLETTGELGFAPVDLAVGTRGELYVAIGGRRTRGGVFRVSYLEDQPAEDPGTELDQILEAPQPLAAWSRATWEPRARELGRDKFVTAVVDRRRPLDQRVRAVEIITDIFGGLNIEEVESLFKAARPELVARILWSFARQPRGDESLRLVVAATRDGRPLVQRSAFEALGAWIDLNGPESEMVAKANWAGAFVSTDRRVQMAAFMADARRNVPIEETSLADLWRLHYGGQLHAAHFSAAAEAFFAAQGDRDRLSAVRMMELCLGDINTRPMTNDVYAGYTLNAEPAIVAAAARQWGGKLATAFPAKDGHLNLELARLLAMLSVDDPALVDRFTQQWTPDTPPDQDLHYLICLSRLPGTRSPQATERTALGLAHLQPKMQRAVLYVSRNWPLRVGEAVGELMRHDPELPVALIACDDFKTPSQALLVRQMPPAAQQAAARKLIQAIQNAAGELRWTDDLVAIVAALPDDEAFAALRSAWEDFAMRDAIVAVLARSPQPLDRQRFVESLAAVQSSTIEAAALALEKLAGDPQEAELVAAFAALRQACLAPEQKSLRQALTKLVTAWTGQSIEIDDPGKGDVASLYQPWFDWFAAAHPVASMKAAALGTVNWEAWQSRLPHIETIVADSDRGKVVFERKACLKCHAGNSPLGPDLAGSAGRFSRADLLAAMVDPSRDVSPLYQTTQVVTASGKIVTGLIIYESPDATLVQTDPDTTVRVAGDEIVAMRKSRTSLMPNGLLNDVGDQEVADLLEYLKMLKPSRP